MNRITKIKEYEGNPMYSFFFGKDLGKKGHAEKKSLNYYKHGPLARVELGNDKVQGIDYAYTIQGWFKGVNSETLDSTRDMGQDGNKVIGNNNANFAKDVFGYSLNYFTGDYSAIGGSSANSFLADKTNCSYLSSDGPSLYNGNISSMVTTITDINSQSQTYGRPLPQLTAYRYDQLNRIRQMKAYNDITANTWGNGGTYTGKYLQQFTYDANGNILTVLAKNDAGQTIDDQTFGYQTISGKLVSNKLYAINDAAIITGGFDLINTQTTYNNTPTTINTANNYSYSEIGELKSDKQDSIAEIKRRVDGKISEVIRINGCTKSNLKFDYDVFGNRTAKHVYSSTGIWQKSEYYVRDAQGNIMSTYGLTHDTQMMSFSQTELHIYGSAPIGISNANSGTELISPLSVSNVYTHTLGMKSFTGANHLGNDLTIFTDRKIAHDDDQDGIIDYYTADITSSRDYGPFGEYLTNRVFEPNDYLNSFNNKRDDPELNGWQDYGMRNYLKYTRRILDRIDPITSKYPMLSPYQFASNTPIRGIDLDGLEVIYMNDGTRVGQYGTSTEVMVVNDKYTLKQAQKYLNKANAGTYNEKQSKWLMNNYCADLGVTEKQLVAFGSVVDAESSGNKDESYAIANVTMNFIDEGGSSQLKTLDDVTMYDNKFAQGATQKNYTSFTSKTSADQNSKFAMGAAINAIGFSKGLQGFTDVSGGSDSWDGIDLVSTLYDNSHRDYIWSDASKTLLSTFKTSNNGGIDVSTWSYKLTGYQIEATKIIGKTLFTNLQGGRGEKKESTVKFK
jgi:hypothetical protein